MLPMLGLASLSLASVGIVGGFLSYNNNVYADGEAVTKTANASADLSVVLDRVLTVTLPADVTTPIEITPTADGEFKSKPVNVTVSTNSPFGYTLNMYAYDTNTNNLTTSLTNTNINTATIDTISTNVSLADFSTETNNAYNNKWGYSMDGGNNYMPISSGAMLIDERKVVNSTEADGSAAGTNTTNLTFGVRSNNDIPSGTYSASLSFVAVTEIPDSTNPAADFNTVFELAGAEKIQGADNEQYYAMQDMSSVICDHVYTPASKDAVHQEAKLIDTRDGSIYYVTKAIDGKCWMTQNLDLNIGGTSKLDSQPIVLNAKNSNISSNDDVYTKAPYIATADEETNGGYEKVNGVWTWTGASATLTEAAISDGTVTGWPSSAGSNATPASFDPGNWYWNGVTDGEVYDSETECSVGGNDQSCSYLKENGNWNKYFQEGIMYEYNKEHGSVGTYYNWTASIASSDSKEIVDSTYDDVSKNPVNSVCPKGWRLPTISANGEYKTLNDLYNDGLTGSGTNVKDDGLVKSPLYFVRGGYINDSGTLSSAGRGGNYWSSTVASDTRVHFLNFRTGHLDPAYSSLRSNGRSVRCVAE